MWPALLQLVHGLDQADEADREVAFERVAALAREQPEEFVNAVEEAPLGQGSPLFWIYEAIARDSEGWESFIGSEVTRVLDAMPGSRSPHSLYVTVGGFALLRSASARQAVTAAALSRAASLSPPVRRAVVNLLGDYAEPEDRNAWAVLRRYRDDPDWRVRVEAFQILNEDRKRPLLEGVGVLDRLRQKCARPTW